jgi:hypothetical protein
VRHVRRGGRRLSKDVSYVSSIWAFLLPRRTPPAVALLSHFLPASTPFLYHPLCLWLQAPTYAAPSDPQNWCTAGHRRAFGLTPIVHPLRLFVHTSPPRPLSSSVVCCVRYTQYNNTKPSSSTFAAASQGVYVMFWTNYRKRSMKRLGGHYEILIKQIENLLAVFSNSLQKRELSQFLGFDFAAIACLETSAAHPYLFLNTVSPSSALTQPQPRPEPNLDLDLALQPTRITPETRPPTSCSLYAASASSGISLHDSYDTVWDLDLLLSISRLPLFYLHNQIHNCFPLVLVDLAPTTLSHDHLFYFFAPFGRCRVPLPCGRRFVAGRIIFVFSKFRFLCPL